MCTETGLAIPPGLAAASCYLPVAFPKCDNQNCPERTGLLLAAMVLEGRMSETWQRSGHATLYSPLLDRHFLTVTFQNALDSPQEESGWTELWNILQASKTLFEGQWSLWN